MKKPSYLSTIFLCAIIATSCTECIDWWFVGAHCEWNEIGQIFCYENKKYLCQPNRKYQEVYNCNEKKCNTHNDGDYFCLASVDEIYDYPDDIFNDFFRNYTEDELEKKFLCCIQEE